jgi:hypothetical protein
MQLTSSRSNAPELERVLVTDGFKPKSPPNSLPLEVVYNGIHCTVMFLEST